jgi:2-methylaconitate cis-trans-isomerase PrpF
MENQLPSDRELRDKVIRAIFGSPDVRQIDGLGGADPLTSKLCIIGPPTMKGTDVDYTFAQVSITTDVVDYTGNCGNLSSGVGPFAIDEGLVRPQGPITKVRIHQVNTNSLITAEVPVKDGRASVMGDCKIDGAPGTGAKIMLDFCETAGAVTGRLLPTKHEKDLLRVDDVGEVEVSIIDAGNPVVFLRAESMGMKGIETPKEIETTPKLLTKIENIRGCAAELIGLVDDRRKATAVTPYVPFIAMVAKSADYVDYTTSETVRESEVDILSRLLFMQVMHKTYPVTGTVCTGAAARIPGTIVNEALSKEADNRPEIRIGHPAGIIEIESSVEGRGLSARLTRAALTRTARRIMEGYVYVRSDVYS